MKFRLAVIGIVLGFVFIGIGTMQIMPSDGIWIAVLVGGVIPAPHKEMTPGSVVPRPSFLHFNK